MRKYLLVIFTLQFLSNNLLSQSFELALSGSAILHDKASVSVVQDTELFGSFAKPQRTLTQEAFLTATLNFKNDFSAYMGFGTGYFNSAYSIKTTPEFSSTLLSTVDNAIRSSSSVSSYYGLRTGIGKRVFSNKRNKLNLILGTRIYFSHPNITSFGLTQIADEMGEQRWTFEEKVINNENETLDYNIDIGLVWQREMKILPLHWNFGLTYSQALTELWNGTLTFNGDNGLYQADLSNKLSFLGFELGLAYRFNKTLNDE